MVEIDVKNDYEILPSVCDSCGSKTLVVPMKYQYIHGGEVLVENKHLTYGHVCLDLMRCGNTFFDGPINRQLYSKTIPALKHLGRIDLARELKAELDVISHALYLSREDHSYSDL